MSEKYLNKEKSLSPNLKKLEAFITTKLPKENIFNIPYITEDFVYTFLTSLDNNKPTGIDNISSKIVKISAPVITKHLTEICKIVFTVSVTAVFRRSGKRQELHHFTRETQPTTQKTTDLYLFCSFCLKFLKNMYTTHCTNFFW